MIWREFTEGVTSLPGGWIYRGGLEHWTHETSLERACNAWKVPLRSAQTVECRLVREFQRHPEVREYLLDADDYLGWLALMQHHGAPTRLLDWSYSPFVAAYCAFEALLSDRSKPANSVHASCGHSTLSGWHAGFNIGSRHTTGGSTSGKTPRPSRSCSSTEDLPFGL